MGMAMKILSFLLPILFFLVLSGSCNFVLVSDGVQNVEQPTPVFLSVPDRKVLVSSASCEDIYGFMPCSDTIIGNTFLIIVYGYFLSLAAKYLSDGSEVLLEILGPGIVGGLILPLLSTLPDAIIILASGLSGSKEIAQSQVSVGMGLLAGSTVFGLTLLWGSCVLAGKCDIENSIAKDEKDTKGLNFTGSGVTTDIGTREAAIIMLISVPPFIIVQLSTYFCTNSQSRLAILTSLILSIFFLLSYCIYQVFRPLIQCRRLAYAKHKHVISGILKHLKQHALGKFFTDDGNPNREVLQTLFRAIDINSDGFLESSEIRALIIGIELNEINLDEHDAVAKVMKEFDSNGDSVISLDEFINWISSSFTKAKQSAKHSHNDRREMKLLSDFHKQTKLEHDLLGDEDDENVEKFENPKWIAFKAVLMLLLGATIAAAFAHPFVDSVHGFSTATNIPSFFVAFIFLPFVRSNEGLEALNFARRKKLRTASLTFSQIYAAVTMSHVLCLSVFLGLVYTRDLTWDFSAEVLVIVIVSLVVGVLASFQNTFPVWTCLVAYALYPLSLLLVYLLQYVIGGHS